MSNWTGTQWLRDWNAIGNDPKIDLIVLQSGGNSLDDGGTDYQTQLNTFFTNLRDNMNGDTEVISIAPYWDGAKHDIHRGIHATLCDTYGFPIWICVLRWVALKGLGRTW